MLIPRVLLHLTGDRRTIGPAFTIGPGHRRGWFDCDQDGNLDLDTMEDQRFTQLDDAGEMRSFDIAPDGRRLVFDRRRANSDIVPIDLEQ